VGGIFSLFPRVARCGAKLARPVIGPRDPPPLAGPVIGPQVRPVVHHWSGGPPPLVRGGQPRTGHIHSIAGLATFQTCRRLLSRWIFRSCWIFATSFFWTILTLIVIAEHSSRRGLVSEINFGREK